MSVSHFLLSPHVFLIGGLSLSLSLSVFQFKQALLAWKFEKITIMLNILSKHLDINNNLNNNTNTNTTSRLIYINYMYSIYSS